MKRLIGIYLAAAMLIGMLSCVCTVSATDPEEVCYTISTYTTNIVKAGKTFQIRVSVNRLKSIGTIEFKIGYDSTKMEFLSGEKCGFFETWDDQFTSIVTPVAPELGGDDIGEVWITGLTLTPSSCDDNEVIAVLTFKALEDIAQNEGIFCLATRGGSVPVAMNGDLENLSTSYVNGGVQISDVLRGDVTEDGIVDIYDAMKLFKYVNEEAFLEQSALAASEINHDGVVDIYDAMRLFKCVNEEIEEL